MQAEQLLSIVRLTKILDRNTSPLPNWLEAWQRGEPVHPFSDLIFAPMSVRFVGQALARLGEQRIPGNLHLSGAENVSYVDFASALASSKGIAPELIAPTTAKAKGIHIAYKPRFSGLGMQRTTALAGVQPQRLADLVCDLLEEN
jgi:dTDP-4-dehydrorhamnose reductase